MRIRRGRRIRPYCWCFAGLGIALVAGSGDAQSFEYVSTFDNIVGQGIEGTVDTPSVAHQELPGAEKSLPPAEGVADRTKQSEAPRSQPPNLTWGSPDSRLSFSPGQRHANPSFVQEGFLVEAFWALKTGTPEASFRPAHFHPPNLSTGFEAQQAARMPELWRESP